MRLLRKGMSGPDVMRWQTFLRQQGFQLDAREKDFGDATHRATLAFQKAEGLDPDGVVGDDTLGAARQHGFEATPSTTTTTTGGGAPSSSPPPRVALTDDVLRRIMRHLSEQKRVQYLPFLRQAMEEFGINTPLRQAAFLAQIAHESGEFRWMEEIWGPTDAQRRYEPPTSKARDLGNTEPGDGKRFKGRGPIQITGRFNYKKYGDTLGVDLVNNPEQAATPEVGFRIAGLYWQKNGCNELADREKFVSITIVINGGRNGLADRTNYYLRAKQVLGIGTTRNIETETEDTGGDAERKFTRGLDAPGEITPRAAERNASETDESISANDRQSSTAKKSGAKKSAGGGANKAAHGGTPRRAAKKGAVQKATAAKSGVKKGSGESSTTKARPSGGAQKAITKSAAKSPAKGRTKKGSAKKRLKSSSKS